MTSQVEFQILALESAIEVLQKEINSLRGGAHVTRTSSKGEQIVAKKRGRKPGTVMSAAARKRIQEAQRKRWDLVRSQAAKQRKAEAAAERETAVAVGQSVSTPEEPEPRQETRPAPRRGRPAKGSKGRD